MKKFRTKRLLSALLAVAMLITMMPLTGLAADEKPLFTDVNGDEYYATAAEVLAKLDILRGYPDGTFGADKNITRAEMAAIILRSQGLEEESVKAQGLTAYDDVTASHWASGYINKATELKIIQGDGDGKFRPDDNVLYEEAIKIVVSSVGLDDAAITAGGWADGYIKVAQENGILKNVPGSKGKTSVRGAVALMTLQGLLTQVKAPVASVESGNYSSTQSVTLTTETKDAKIYYTLDGKDPTIKSTEYSKAITINKSATLKAITVKDGLLNSDILSVAYTITKSIGGGGGGGGSSSTPTKYDVEFDLNYEGAVGAPEKQSIAKNGLVVKPADPERAGYTFGGWYKEASCENEYNFVNDIITTNVTLYAKWVLLSTVNLSASNTEFMVDSGSQTVYFYAETDGNVEVLHLVDGDDNTLAEMKDDGLFSQSGDDLQNDNVFSCKIDIPTTQEGVYVYKAICDENSTISSNDVTIYIIAEFTQEELTDIKAVDDAIALLIENEEYLQSEVSIRKTNAEELIEDLCSQGLIIEDSVFYDVSAFMFTFTYKSGALGAIYIEDFDDEYNGLTLEERKAQAPINQSNPATLSNISLMNTPIDLGDAIILNAFENTPFRRDFYDILEDNWNNNKLNTVVDTDVTVEDIKNLQNYEVIVFSGHGAYYTHKYGFLWLQSMTEPVWCLNEVANSDKDKKYSADLKQHRVVKANNTYYVFPSLIRETYSENDLRNSFVFSESCEFMGKNGNVVESMPDAFISRSAKAVIGFHNSVYAVYSREFMNDYVIELINGGSAQDACNQAIAENGANHNVWYERTYPNQPIPDNPIAYPLLRGNVNATLFNTNILNPDFEISSTSLTHWNTFGDVRVISKLGEVSPTSNIQMAILTTGIGSGEADYLAGTEGSVMFQTVKLASDVSTLSFDYNVISEEPHEFVGSEYDDTFKIEILDVDGNVVKEVTMVTVNSATWTSVGGINFEGGDNTVYQTGWQNASFDISEYKNQLITIRFVVFDVGDSIFDTAAVVDNVKLN